MRARLHFLFCFALFTILSANTAAKAQIDRGLTGPTHWMEHAYGMSLTAPPDARWIEQTDDGALVKFQCPPATTISIYIRKADIELELPAVKDKAIREFVFGYPTAVAMEQDSKPINVAERESLGLFMLVPDDKRSDWVFAQVYTPIDPHTIAVYQLECDAQDFDSAFQAFQTMLASVTFSDPAELDRERTERINRGKAWLESIDREMTKGALIPEQWLRITQAGKDVGYIRIREVNDADRPVPGISITINSRIISGPNTYDTEGKFFESDDRQIESWEITTTKRIPQYAANLRTQQSEPDTLNWHQAGIRNGDEIQVTQHTPTSIKPYSWQVPPFTYLSQVDLYVLPALLPRDKPTELAFYSFHHDSVKLSLRTLRIEPLPGGSYRVYDRPTPDRAEQVATFSPTGRLAERRMADGRVYLATTPQELKRIWGILGSR